MKKQKKLFNRINIFLSTLIICSSQGSSMFFSNKTKHWGTEKATLKTEWIPIERSKKRTFWIKPLSNKINLNKRYFPNRVWVKERGYNGLWIKNNGKKWGNREFNLTNAFLSRSRYFPLPFYEIEFFTSYKELLSFLDYDIKISWKHIVNNICKSYKNRLKKLIVLFYNFIANIFPNDDINYILKKISVEDLLGALGSAAYQHIILKKDTLYCNYTNVSEKEWATGLKTSKSIFKTIFHELGHLVQYVYEYKKIDPIIHLKEFLIQKIDNLHNLDQEKVFQLFHLSNHSFANSFEFFAEGFAYLFLAPGILKTKAWEFWYEFHTWYLPNLLRAKNNRYY